MSCPTPPRGSQPERELATQLHLAGVAPPIRNLKFWEGRRLEFDFAWPREHLAVEVNGGVWRVGGGAHSRPRAILRDYEKAQLAVLAGYRFLPVSPADVKSGRALRMIEHLLAKPRDA